MPMSLSAFSTFQHGPLFSHSNLQRWSLTAIPASCAWTEPTIRPWPTGCLTARRTWESPDAQVEEGGRISRASPIEANSYPLHPLRSRDHRTYRTANGQTCANSSDQPCALTLAKSHALHRVWRARALR